MEDKKERETYTAELTKGWKTYRSRPIKAKQVLSPKIIFTPDGNLLFPREGDYVLIDEMGHMIVCRPNVFERVYELVDDKMMKGAK